MKRASVYLFLAVFAMTQIAPLALAEEKGPITKDYPVAWNIVSFPLRVVTAAGGAVVGFVTGGTTGVIDTEKDFSKQTYAKAADNPVMAPVGVLGSIAAVPVGIVTGGPKGAVDFGKKGFYWWSKF